MTNDEVRQVLKKADRLLGSMDRVHVERLFQAFIGDLQGNTKTTFSLSELRKAVRNLIHNCIDMPHPVDWLSHKQMKRIYKILGDYECYPVCGLCGKPIKIDSVSLKINNASYPLIFSWDHIIPKSWGGATVLRNLQPAHKICNNHKGRNIPEEYRIHYDISVNTSMKVDCPACSEICDKQKSKTAQYVNLRKQDSWCHKHKKTHAQHHR